MKENWSEREQHSKWNSQKGVEISASAESKEEMVNSPESKQHCWETGTRHKEDKAHKKWEKVGVN